MALHIPQDVIEKIRDEIAIEEVIRHYLPLQASGRTFKGRCPFHNEKTPSFHAIPEKQIFYCYGCHKGGDVFRFLMEKEGMAFPEAVEWCASRLGLDLTRYAVEGKGATSKAPLYEATQWAQEWFIQNLKGDDGRKARSYLRERGVKPETIEAFGLGFAPEDGSRLEREAKVAGIRQETLLQVSLLGRKEKRPPFAYFRARLIFPIRGVASKIHGFGGRILGPGEPKYLNSPETSIFQKRSILYGLPEARSSIVRGRKAILVEGYTDVLALHQAGWSQTVATCGTSFTKEQAATLRRYADTVVLLFDGDTAGRKAAFKSADIALAAGLDVRIVRLPKGRDPADMLLDGEGSALSTGIENAPGLVASMAEEVALRGDLREAKERALHHIQESLRQISDPIRRELMAQEAGEAFGVRASLLFDAGEERSKTSEKTSSHEPHEPIVEGAWFDTEYALLKFAMAAKAARRRLFEILSPEDLRDPRLREIFRALHGRDAEFGEGADARLQSSFQDDDTESMAARLLADQPSEGLDALAELDAALQRRDKLLERAQRESRREQLHRKYAAGEDWRGDLPQDEDDSADESI